MNVVIASLLALVFAAGPRIGGESRDAKGIKHSGTEPALRIKTIAPVAAGVLRCRPTFCSCGVCYGAETPVEGMKLLYRIKAPKAGFFARIFGGGKETEWKTARDFPYFSETKDYRGSILDLAEATDYEVRLAAGEKVLAADEFRTWSSVIKVAKTVTIDPKTAKLPIRISDRGTDDGWIRYTVKPGEELKSTTVDPVIIVDGATNVVIEGVTFTGSRGRSELTIENSENVRVVNCRFSHWGRDYEIRYDGLGRPYEIGKPPKKIVRNIHGGFSPQGGVMVNFDGAIRIGNGSVGTVVERCWFHDCRIHSNSWYYSHPTGGEAIMMCQPEHSTVIRWNDFTGSDIHRWNDAVESGNNFGENGGFNRDADVYGNFFIFAADDCIELDGGQQNVRCFDNRFESALCGISIQGCMASPVYLFRNGFFGMCDEFCLHGQTIKTGGGPHGEEACAFVDDNLLWGEGSGISMWELLRTTLRNNRFCGRQRIGDMGRSPYSSSTGDEFKVEIPEAELPVGLPARPAGFILDRARFGDIRMAKGVVTPSALTVTAKSTSQAAIPFEVVWNDDTPWIKVEPKIGVIQPGGEQRFTVTFDTAKMNNRHFYRGAFLVRAANGLSRGVSLYVETDFVPPFKPEKPGDIAVYLPASPDGKAVQLKKGDKTVHTYEFTVPKDGRYHFMFHAVAEKHGDLHSEAALDDDAFEPFGHLLWTHPVWAPVAPGNKFGNKLRFWDFKKGEKHVLRIRSGKNAVSFDQVVMTDNPGSFEPR